MQPLKHNLYIHSAEDLVPGVRFFTGAKTFSLQSTTVSKMTLGPVHSKLTPTKGVFYQGTPAIHLCLVPRLRMHVKRPLHTFVPWCLVTGQPNDYELNYGENLMWHSQLAISPERGHWPCPLIWTIWEPSLVWICLHASVKTFPWCKHERSNTNSSTSTIHSIL